MACLTATSIVAIRDNAAKREQQAGESTKITGGATNNRDLTHAIISWYLVLYFSYGYSTLSLLPLLYQ